MPFFNRTLHDVQERLNVLRLLGLFLVGYAIAGWFLVWNNRDVEHLLVLLDGGNILLSLVLGLLLLDIGKRTQERRYVLIAWSMLIRMVFELVHASTEVQLGSALTGLTGAFQSLIPYTSVISPSVLPAGIMLSWNLRGRYAGILFIPLLAIALLVVKFAVQLMYGIIPFPWLAAWQPAMIAAVLAWVALSYSLMRISPRDDFGALLVGMSMFFIIGDSLTLTSTGGLEHLSVEAHLGRFLGFLFLLFGVVRVAAIDVERRNRIEVELRDSEERYRAVAETATDAIITMTLHGRIIFANHATEAIFGHPANALPDTPIVALIPAALQHLKTAGTPGNRVELDGLRRNGEHVLLEISFGAFHREDETLYTAVIRNIDSRKQAERRLTSQYELTRLLAEAESLEEAAPRMLQIVCESAGGHLALLWRPNRVGGRLHCAELWQLPDQKLSAFISESLLQTYALGEGFPGRVAKELEALWWDTEVDNNYPRNDAARQSGIRNGFGFPILSGGAAIGVLEIFSTRSLVPDPSLLRTMHTLGSQIGQFIDRRKTEQDRRQLLQTERLARQSAELARERIAFLSNVTGILLSSLDYYERLEGLAELCVPAIADWCAIDIAGDDHLLSRIAVAHRDPSRIDLVRQIAQTYPEDPASGSGVYNVMRTGRAEIYRHISDEMMRSAARDVSHYNLLRELNLVSIMILPLTARGKTFGTITFAVDAEERAFNDDDLNLAREIASRASLAIDNARLYLESQSTLRELQRKNHEFERLNAELEQRVFERTEELSRYIKELESFSYSVAHDLRAPLRSINGFAHALLEDYGDSIEAAGAQYLHTIARSAKEMGQLIDDLLSFSRLSRRSMESAPVVMRDLIASILHELMANETARTIRTEVGPVPNVLGDRSMLRQALGNIIENAVKFTRNTREPVIRIGVIEKQGETVFFVEDNGVGFENEYAQKIFGVFHRLHPQEEFEGTGIGLSIAQRVIQRHGGRIWAEGEVDRGSTFYFTLPVIPGTIQPVQDNLAEHPQSSQ